MSVYQCPQCQSVEFFRIETIQLSSKGEPLQTNDDGIMKCANCGTKIQVKPYSDAAGSDGAPGSISVLNPAPVPSAPVGNRVRSSASADQRGMGIPNESTGRAR